MSGERITREEEVTAGQATRAVIDAVVRLTRAGGGANDWTELEMRVAEVMRAIHQDGLTAGAQRAREVAEALEWIKERDAGGLPWKLYHASTDMVRQEAEWKCPICPATFISYWPEWIEPTERTFFHARDCRYEAMAAALARFWATVQR
jgi:hypothetical protein